MGPWLFGVETLVPDNSGYVIAVSSGNIKRYLVAGLLIMAIALRLIYGYDLTKNIRDETNRLELIQTLSIQDGKVVLPMGSSVSHHPVLVTYLTAIVYWLTDGAIYGVRIVFILFSVFGLMGLFYLARELFGYRVAIFALFLGATDHYLISYAPEFLENVYLCLVPWLMLAVFRAVELDKENYWIVIGIIGGLGYMCFELFALLVIPIIIIAFSSGKTLKIVSTPQLYIGLVVFALIGSPNFFWNYNHHFVNYSRHIEKALPIGFVPRMAMLYLGDLLINLKNSSHLMLSMGTTIYGPWFIPCHWVSGLLYLFSTGYCLKEIKSRHHAILFIFLFAIIIPISMINAKEPWNEFEWGAMSIFPVLCLTAWAIDKLIVSKIGRVFYITILTVIFTYTAVFLAGPKCGYASPFWEKAFLGDMFYYVKIKEDKQAASTLVEAAIKQHPDCAIAYYFRNSLSSDPKQKEASLQKVLTLEPFNPLACGDIAVDLMRGKKHDEAYRLLLKTVQSGNNFWQIQRLLGVAAYNLGNYPVAEDHLRQAIAIKSDTWYIYWDLFRATVSQCNFDEGLLCLETLAMHTDSPEDVYQRGANMLLKMGEYAQAAALYRKARRINPDLPERPSRESAVPY